MNRSEYNLRKADELYRQAKKSGLNYGCLEVALLALGSYQDKDLTDLLKGQESLWSSVWDIIHRSGFKISWFLNLPPNLTAKDIVDLLEGNIPELNITSNRVLAGYLGFESYTDPEKDNHVLAIIPRDYLSRDLRRSLKKNDAYLIVDTASGGVLQMPAENLARYSQRVVENKGQFAISKLCI